MILDRFVLNVWCLKVVNGISSVQEMELLL